VGTSKRQTSDVEEVDFRVRTACLFQCNLRSRSPRKDFHRDSSENDAIKLNLVNHFRELVRLSPLEIFEKAIKTCKVSASTGERLFRAYAEFLNMLNDEGIRSALESLRAKDSRTDATFQKIREISAQFEDALGEIFFENPILAPLIRKYGVF
jgi:hypothetical protein